MPSISIWDWPTRLIHWLLVALVFFSWGSAEYGYLDLHRYSGYTILGLLVFRIYWGFAGSETARFAGFLKGPRAVLIYIRTQDALGSPVGHNPLGALSVVALLALLLAQVGLGLFAVDLDGLESGPLSHWVSFEAGRLSAKLHGIVFNTLLVFIALHLAAVLFYLLFRRNNLIGPMFSGKKSFASAVVPARVGAPWPRVALGLILAGAVVWAIV